MKLFEIYENMNSSDIWSRFEDYLSKETLLQEIDSSNVNELLSESRLLIFKAFGINPEQKGTYFLGGSARLFKNPKLLKVLNQIDRSYPLAIGDLDFVVPGEQEWKNLYKNYTTDSSFIEELGKKIGEKNIPTVVSKFKKQWERYDGKIYRPGSTGLKLSNKDIEAFDEWRPDLAGDAKDLSVRPTEKIMSDSVKVGGYYFMNIYDVFDYKSQLNRKKEKAIVGLLSTFLDGSLTSEEAEKLFKDIQSILGKKK
tara:strand:+ start:73 stop:834 length:762 start_codon:yes stop_codon:yes gene_type:complete